MSLAIGKGLSFPIASFFYPKESTLRVSNSLITDVFQSSVPLVDAVADLSEKEIVSLSNLWKSPANVLIGGVWSALFIFHAFSAIDIGSKLFSCSTGEGVGSEGSTQEEERWENLKNSTFSEVSLVGTVTAAGVWAHEKNIVSLGEAISSVKMIGFGAQVIANGIKIYEYGKQFFDRLGRFKEVDNDAEYVRLSQKQLLTSLNLGAYLVGAGWAVLELLDLLIGIPFSSFYASAISFILAISAFFYGAHLNHLYPKHSLSGTLNGTA